MGKCPDDCAHPTTVERCRYCSVDGQVNPRLETWQSARSALENADWGEYDIQPADVLFLSLFLTGELHGEATL